MLKKIIPLVLRTRVKSLGYAVKDLTSPPLPPRVPPRRLTFIGGGDFIAVGDAFKSTLIRHGLKPDMDVLDVGCGQGRMARPLVNYIDSGSYTGFDIVCSGIDWCRNQYRGVSHFRFDHADVFNARYNKTGRSTAADYIFPYANDQFDMIFLTSVFTHMYAKDVENYLSEIARVLKPGGQCLITWFLLDAISSAAVADQTARMDFRFAVDTVSKTTVAKNPEAAIAFDLDYARTLYEKTGLTIKNIEYGHWARPESRFDLQDLVIASPK